MPPVCASKLDDRDTVTPGWKFNEWELKGVPVRVEIGPRDLAEGKVMSVRRDTFEKAPLDIEGLEGEIKAMLDAIQNNMFEIARTFRDEHTADVHNMEELEKQVNGGYAKAMWCGEQTCEDEIKNRFGASSRCMPFNQGRRSAKPASAAASLPRRSSISPRPIDESIGITTGLLRKDVLSGSLSRGEGKQQPCFNTEP